MLNCIFCKIIAGELPCYKVYENNNVLAFLDIAPVSYGHILVVPKKHFVNIEDIPEDELRKVITVVKKIGKALKSGLCAPGYNVSVNNDPIAGQIVPHIHFHVIPRKQGDGLQLWPQGKYGNGEAEEVLKKIQNKM